MKHDELLTKWLNNEISEAELEHLNSSPEHASYLRIAEAASKLSPPEFNEKENYKSITSNASFQQDDLKDSTIRPLRSMKSFLKVAAVFAILFTGFHLFNTMDTSVKTTIAEKRTIELPDHSEVVLNARSEMTFNKKNWDKNRTISLNGEAFFSVARGNKFDVITKQGTVSVLGTQFNVFARDDKFYINCYEGLVSVSLNGSKIELQAGKELKIENGLIIYHDSSNTENPSWLLNESYFENTTLALVLQEIERQYPIKITTDNINVEKRFTGAFTHNDLDLALKSVCEPLNLAYSISGNDDVTLYAKGNK
jgi:ferric-dicitrate binding protein FerR (iron transport regulator)